MRKETPENQFLSPKEWLVPPSILIAGLWLLNQGSFWGFTGVVGACLWVMKKANEK